MPSTVYKGDLAEVTFGHETSLYIEHGHPSGLTFSGTDNGDGTTRIRFSNGSAAAYFSATNQFLYPKNMLVGARVRFIGNGSSSKYALDDYANHGHVYTIVSHEGVDIHVAPALRGNTSGTVGDSVANDVMIIDSFGVPALDEGMTYHADSNNSACNERVLTDQFLGLAGTITLPETKADIKRYHVVGLGRDVAVQAPGKFTYEGGSFEIAMHSARWLYYALGGLATRPDLGLTGGSIALNGAAAAGQSYIDFDNGGSGSIQLVDGSTTPDVGDYIFIGYGMGDGTLGADLIPLINHAPVDFAAIDTDTGTGQYFGDTNYDIYAEIHDDSGSRFDATLPIEMRRIVALNHATPGSATRYYLDEPLSYSHADNTVCKAFRYGTAGMGSPSFTTTAGSFGIIDNPVYHVIYTASELPSFCLETSVRKRDVGSYSNEDGTSGPDTVGDSGQLTRVFRGCKVGSFTMSADTDAALKMTVGFNAAHCYTDTGRLGSTPGDRYTAHRMFENTANTDQARLESGIGKHTQKPFFFYNGSVSVAGKSVAQVTNFSLTGNTGVTHVHTISGSPVATNVNTTSGLSLDQVPFGGSRNPSIAVAGKATYDMSMEIITDDPTFFHHMRATDEFSNRTGSRITNDGIKLDFIKQGASGVRERMTIFIDEYYIAEAPIPIPEDKGMIRSALKIVPQSIKVVATDTMFHY